MIRQKKIELKSEEVNELLNADPPWIVRWGLMLIFLIMLLVLSLSFFIKYPNILSATATITTFDPAAALEKQKLIAKLFLPIQNSEKLKTGQRVNIKLNNYPFQDYGILNGIVKSISIMPNNEC